MKSEHWWKAANDNSYQPVFTNVVSGFASHEPPGQLDGLASALFF
jgi:hypothetical protein